MYERINYFLVGIFVIILSSLAFYFALWLAKEDKREDSYNRYIVYFEESVDGLNKDSTVKLNGVNIGRVKKLAIDKDKPFRVKVDILINKEILITKDMYATLQGQGLTGLRYINIIGGKSSEVIKPNSNDSIIVAKESMVSKLSNNATDILQKVQKVLSKENLDNIAQILINSKAVTKRAIDLENRLIAIVGESNTTNKVTLNELLNSMNDINSTLIEYKELAKSGKDTLKMLNQKLPKIFNSIQSGASSVKSAANIIKRTVKSGDYNLKRILSPAVNELQILSNDYRELADELKSLIQDPSGTILDRKRVPKGPGE